MDDEAATCRDTDFSVLPWSVIGVGWAANPEAGAWRDARLRDFDAVGDGRTKDTRAMQRAIVSHALGGGHRAAAFLSFNLPPCGSSVSPAPT